MNTDLKTINKLPKLNCGNCGAKTCDEFALLVDCGKEDLKKCIYTSNDSDKPIVISQTTSLKIELSGSKMGWKDHLDREFDFILDSNDYDPGPREIIQPFNPILLKELQIKKGDSLIGRPMGMSCGCPVTHCGTVIEADHKNGVIVWCVTGPIKARNEGFVDIGYYVAHAYEGVVKESKVVLVIGKRYWFMPRCCMLQWRHSGLINTITKLESGKVRVRIEGLYIG